MTFLVTLSGGHCAKSYFKLKVSLEYMKNLDEKLIKYNK